MVQSLYNMQTIIIHQDEQNRLLKKIAETR
jgi:hypothetical protein